MRHLFYKYSLIVVGILLVSSTWAAPSEAERIYKTARQKLLTTSFTTESVSTVGQKKVTDKFYQMVSADGIIRSRHEIASEPALPFDPSNPFIVIKNENGRFEISRKSAMKLNGQVGRKPLDEEGLIISYKLEEQDFEGTPCYKVTRSIAVNRAAQNAFIESLPPDSQKYADFNSLFPAYEILLVGKNDLFPRATSTYNKDGKLIGTKLYSNLVLNPVLDASLFEVPTNQITIINSIQEYADATTKEVEKEIAKNQKHSTSVSWWSELGIWCDQEFNLLVDIGVWTGIVIAVLAIIAAVVLKIKQR